MGGLDIHLRWMLRRDMPGVMRIEQECFGDEAMSESFMLDQIGQTATIAMVAEVDGIIRGYMVYHLHRHYIDLMSLAVDERWQGRGIGSAMLRKIETKLSLDRRMYVTSLVSEWNETAHAFFKANGWLAVKVVHGAYIDRDDDGYLFRRTYAEVLADQLIGVTYVQAG